MNKLLIVSNMQNDLVKEAFQAELLIPNIVNKIHQWDDEIVFLMDIHSDENYGYLIEEELRPKHCIKGTWGAMMVDDIFGCYDPLYHSIIERDGRIGSYGLIMNYLFPRKFEEIEIVGMETNTSIITDALMIRSAFPRTKIFIDPNYCAGTSYDLHLKALDIMNSCFITIRR